jgi:hypothetical protein
MLTASSDPKETKDFARIDFETVYPDPQNAGGVNVASSVRIPFEVNKF